MSVAVDAVVLPGAGLAVSPLCLGGNRLGSALDERASFELLDEFVALGGSFVDTALVYANWLPGVERSCSERTIGRWLARRGHPQDVVVATKGGHPPLEDPRRHRLDVASLRHDASRSLEHLGRARLDLFYLHRDDESTPVEQIVESLEALRAEGLVRSYAACNWRPQRLAAAQRHAGKLGVQGFVAHQPGWSLAAPAPGSLAPGLMSLDWASALVHLELGLPVVPYSAQARGWFDRAAGGSADTPRPEDDAYDTPVNQETARLLVDMAARYRITPTQLALAALRLGDLTVIPVVGCRTPEQLRSSWSALSLNLSNDDRSVLRSRLRASLAATVTEGSRVA